MSSENDTSMFWNSFRIPQLWLLSPMLNTILTGEGVFSGERFLILPFMGKGGGKGMGEMGIFFLS